MDTGRFARVPEWARSPFSRFLKDQIRAHEFYHLAIEGITIIRYSFQRMEELTEQLKALDEKSGIEHEDKPEGIKTYEEMKRRAERARREAERGFPVLNEQSVVNLWSSLETLITEIVACWIKNVPSAKQSEAVRKVPIRLSDYEAMSAEERLFYMVDELERDLSAPLKQGVNRFEVLLALFGLSGEVGDTIKRELFELSHMRNIIIHRRGMADKKLVDACPWLALKTGDLVTVTSDMYVRYFDAVHAYVGIVLGRVKQCVEVPPASAAEKNSLPT